MKTSPYKYMAIAWLLAVGLSAQAAPYFANEEGNLVWDKATGLVWMRCSLGQTWNGKTCNGNATGFNFEQAQDAARSVNAAKEQRGFNDWEVPNARQLATIRECSNGLKSNELKDLEDGKPKVADGCRPVAAKPTIDSSIFSGTKDSWYWSSSPAISWGSDRVWVLGFDFGGFGINRSHYLSFVRLVRASQLSSAEAASVFIVNLTEQRQTVQRKVRDERQAAENKARSDRVQAVTQLLALGVRGMYLEAGKAQRSGSVTFVNTSFGANELYEMIVDKFPDSEYAVKATDQLTAMSRSAREQAATHDAANRAAESKRAAQQPKTGFLVGDTAYVCAGTMFGESAMCKTEVLDVSDDKIKVVHQAKCTSIAYKGYVEWVPKNSAGTVEQVRAGLRCN